MNSEVMKLNSDKKSESLSCNNTDSSNNGTLIKRKNLRVFRSELIIKMSK